MSTRRSALGRGLGALIPGPPETDGPAPASADAAPGREPEGARGPRELPIDAIDPNPEQPRRRFDAERLRELADSIRRDGVLQPVVVRRAGERFELIMGERRWRAAQQAGLGTIPAVVSDVEDRQLLELAIVENVQRQDLNPIELAHAYRALAETGATQEEIGRRVSKDRSSIANHLRLLDLSREIQEDVETGRLTMGHAKALLQIPNPERRRQLRDRVLAEGLAVRETERLGRELAGPASPRKGGRPARDPEPEDPHLTALVERLSGELQTRVRIRGDGHRGRIEIEYFETGDLDRISRILLEGA